MPHAGYRHALAGTQAAGWCPPHGRIRDAFTASLDLERISAREMEWATLLEYRVRK